MSLELLTVPAWCLHVVSFARNIGLTWNSPLTTGKGHVWTAPGCQGIDHVAALVGAAMCSAYQCGSQGRWP